MSFKPSLTVLFENDYAIVVAKPPKMSVHRTSRTPNADVALQRVRNQVGGFVFPIHRLDRGASGCLIFAKKQEMAGPLHQALTAASAEKIYVALVRGNYRNEAPMLVDNAMKDLKGVVKAATSVVERLGSSREPRCSLMLVRPSTGRYHQVRRHVRDLNHPIIGDSEHGDSRVNKVWRKAHQLQRLGLHCLSISLELPTGGRLEAVSPLFKDQFDMFSGLPWWNEAIMKEPLLTLKPLTGW